VRAGAARFAGVAADGVVESVDVRAEPERLRTPGWWALVGTFEGDVRAWRFDEVRTTPAGRPGPAAEWRGPAPREWTSSLDEGAYRAGVESIRRAIRAGDVYQVNLCRVLSAPLPRPDAAALHGALEVGNPAPFAGFVDVPPADDDPGAWVVTASPELFLAVDGGVVTSAPIKGTARDAAGLADKDVAENVMITDLVRNDLQRVCRPGTVAVTSLLERQEHPGLVHLVSTVRGRLDDEVVADGALWSRLLEATYPPGSVSGAPKSSALRVIADLEPVPRGPYCGLVGWVRVGPDDSVRCRLAVGIRTFWWSDEHLHFGTGAGITWGSDAGEEWRETELKAHRLVGLASSDQ
jgi:para-aminobenzoate synthetase component 1